MPAGASDVTGAVALRWAATVACLSGVILLAPDGAPPPAPIGAQAAALPSGFQESVVFSGLTNPTVVRFSPDGRVFVAEKSGLVKVFDSLADPTPSIYADLRTTVYNFWDRGLLGLALHPSYPTVQDVYALYAYDHELGSSAPPPKWGTPGATSDPCPTPPGANGDGCVVSGRLSVLRPSSSLPYRDTVLSDSPAAYWRLGETSGTSAADASGNGRTGTYVGSPSLGQQGALVGDASTAVAFNGSSQYVSVPYSATLNPTRFSVEAWAYVTGGDGTYRSVVTSRDYAAGAFHRGYVLYAGSEFWEFWLGTGPGWDSVYGPAVTKNVWTHLVATYDGTILRFYVNGLLAGSKAMTLSANTARTLRIAAGNTEGPVNFFFPGRVDEVSVYPDALPEARVLAHYNAGAVSQGVAGETVLVEDWCQQYPSHSTGTVEFGPDGKLYASGGDGSSFVFADWGQDGSPLNPCGDPPGGVGAPLTPPTAEGGSLRSQDLRTPGDPTTLDGTVIRVDPATGAAPPDNPLAGSTDPNARRIIAYGMRNPFRFTFRPGTSEIWLGEVGWGEWEEINRILNPTDSVVENFGWPCYEGNSRQSAYDAADLSICEALYGANADTKPYHSYHHDAQVVPGDGCPTGSSSISGLAFEFSPAGSVFPADYQGALFFTDFSRKCIWVMKKDGSGPPTPGRIELFASAAPAVQLEFGPDGNLYYVDFDGGTIRRITYTGAPAPTCQTGEYQADYFSNATLTGSATFSRCEGTIDYDWGSGGAGNGVPADGFSARWRGNFNFAAGDTTFTVTSNDGMRLWLDGSLLIDKWFDQSATTYTATRSVAAGVHEVKVEYYENTGAAVARVSWAAAANAPPTPTITTPTANTTWKVGDTILFSGSATDPEDGTMPSAALTWTLLLQHCPSTCHTHTLQSWPGIASGSFVAPDHEYPSYLELQLRAVDSGGSSTTASIRLDPITTVLTFASSPTGLQLAVNSASGTTPFTRTVIVGSTSSISAPSPQTLGGTTYAFQSWSDGGAQSHNLVAPAAAATYTATYASSQSAPTNTTLPSIAGQPREGSTLTVSTGVWAGSTPMTFAYQWLRCAPGPSQCAPIAGASASTYVPVAADVGSRLRAMVTATNAAGSASATSNATAAIKRAR